MSNHFSAADLKCPGDDVHLDLTDLFVFAAPDNPDRTVLIMDCNPFAKGDGFHPDAVYRFNIDTDGDGSAGRGVQLRLLRIRQRPANRHRLLLHRQPRPNA